MRRIINTRFLKKQAGFRLLTIVVSLAGVTPLFAQAGIGVAGGHASSAEISISYSVGQVFNHAISNAEYYVSQGIQHPMLLVISEVPEHATSTAGVKVYPNPATEVLHIDRQVDEQGDCRVLLMNMQGQVLIDKTFHSSAFVLPLETVGAGSYVLKITSGKTETITYKILKAK